MKSSKTSSQGSANSDDRPLVITRAAKRKRSHSDPQQLIASAWPCARCGCLLGALHLSLGIFLLFLDVLTNSISHASYAITAALAYIICALLAFIASRRLDRCAMALLMCFCVFAALASLSIFLQSSVDLNRICNDGTQTLSLSRVVSSGSGEEGEGGDRDGVGRGRDCVAEAHAVLTALICIALSEFVVCCTTLIVCFRSLRSAYGVQEASSPYSTLIIGNYRVLERKPIALDVIKPEFHALSER